LNDFANTVSTVRLEWSETRREEAILVHAELSPAGEWTFFERSIWEVRWYRVPQTAELLATAERTLRGNSSGSDPRAEAQHA
jgi:hypothetical protein